MAGRCSTHALREQCLALMAALAMAGVVEHDEKQLPAPRTCRCCRKYVLHSWPVTQTVQRHSHELRTAPAAELPVKAYGSGATVAPA